MDWLRLLEIRLSVYLFHWSQSNAATWSDWAERPTISPAGKECFSWKFLCAWSPGNCVEKPSNGNVLSLVRTQASIGPWYLLGRFQEPKITASSKIQTVLPCLTFLQKLGPPGLWSLPLGRQLSPLILTAVELHILGSKVTHCGEKLALFMLLFLRKSYPPDFWSWPLDGDQLHQYLLDGVHVRILGAKVILCGGKLALRTYFSALESAVYPFFTRILSFLPLSSTSMFPISFFNLVAKFLPSNFTSFPTRSNVLTIRPTPVAKKSTLLPPAYHSQQVLSVVLQLCTSFYLPSSSAVFSKSHLLGDEVDLYGWELDLEPVFVGTKFVQELYQEPGIGRGEVARV